MITTFISIGNSRGIRIPKPLIVESGLDDTVEIKVKKGEIRILAVPMKKKAESTALLLSESVLATDCDRPEEDKAWESLQ